MGSVLYLSKAGDSFVEFNHIEDKELRKVNFETDQIDPYFQKSQECKTYLAVIKFLEGLKENNIKTDNINFYHYHNSKYPDHNLIKGDAHECSIEKMIDFAKMRIEYKKSLHGTFDKIGKIVGHSFFYLFHAAIIPVLGFIPLTIAMGLGVVQTIAGIALSIIFAVPGSFGNKNSRIILERSSKHIIYGPVNILACAIFAIPFVGIYICYKMHWENALQQRLEKLSIAK